MDIDKYQQQAIQTAIYQDADTNISHFGFGLLAEAGEVAGIFQKYFRGDEKYADFDSMFEDDNYSVFSAEAAKMLEKELGDVLWYLAILADTFGMQLSDIAAANIKKLHDRQERGVIQGDGDNR